MVTYVRQGFWKCTTEVTTSCLCKDFLIVQLKSHILSHFKEICYFQFDSFTQTRWLRGKYIPELFIFIQYVAMLILFRARL
jgi:hypothetical protein